jgi:Family of unknown function (DUF6325)
MLAHRPAGVIETKQPVHNRSEGLFMTLGPLEYTVIGFEGNNFDGSIAREIAKVVENGTIALIDVVLVSRDGDGHPVVLELDNKDDPRFAGFHSLVSGTVGLFTEEDLLEIAESLPANTSGLILLFEHRWAVQIKKAIQDAGGFLVTRTVIPPEVVEEVSAELDAEAATA